MSITLSARCCPLMRTRALINSEERPPHGPALKGLLNVKQHLVNTLQILSDTLADSGKVITTCLLSTWGCGEDEL